MNFRIIHPILAVLFFAFVLSACDRQPREIIIDNDFVGNVMVNGGVIVGDGLYSVPLPDGRSIFLIGDSFVGEVAPDGTFPFTHMYRNSYVFYDPVAGRTESYVNSNGPETSAAVPPGVTAENKEWYWPQGGIVLGDKLYVFQSDLYQKSEGMWGFAARWVDLMVYELPSMRVLRQERIRKNCDDGLIFGATACQDGEYVYIYAPGTVEIDGEQKTQSFVARTREEDIFGDWEYMTGDGWSADPSEMVPMEGTGCVEISALFNVFRLRDKYVLLTESKPLFSEFIYTFVSDTPYGPWTNAKRIYDITLPREGLFAYNAVGHPEFIEDDRILVSYNVNSLGGNEGPLNVADYRPVFMWVPIEMILE